MAIEDMSNMELALAVVKCIDTTSGSQCRGCPCDGMTFCAYNLKLEVMKRLISGDHNAEQDH